MSVDVRVPGDKSISHRALIVAALARGTSRIRGILDGQDCRSTAQVLRGLGLAVPELDPGTSLAITGAGPRGMSAPASPLDCGNSGTTARLMLGVLAAQPFTAELTGDASLRSRPMRRVTEPLAAMGARFDERGAADRLPIRAHGGALRPLRWTSPRASAQVKSAILLAGLCAGVPVEVSEPVLSRDHTERMLRACGVRVETRESAGCAVAALEPTGDVAPLDIDVPGDVSSAAFFLALGALAGGRPLRVTGIGLNPGRIGLLAVLRRMGAAVEVSGERESAGEPVGDVVVEKARLSATRVDAAELPSLIDEVPVLAILAARADGVTEIRGAAELRVKESDRLAVLAANLTALGVDVEELEDGLRIAGTDAPLRGRVACHGDHRIAMAFGVLAAAAGEFDGAGRAARSAIHIDQPAAADVSFPGFWELLHATAAELTR